MPTKTVQPQPFSLVGDGAGSIFKIFTTAAALDMGWRSKLNSTSPEHFMGKGLEQQRHPRLSEGNLVCA